MSRSETRPTLLSRVRDPRDDASWREFDEQYRDLILRYGRRLGLQPANAEDVRQLVMMGLLRSLPTFQYRPERGRFRDYLGRIVRNAVSAYVSCPEGATRELLLGEMDRVDASAASEEDRAWKDEWVQHHFRRALAKADRCFDPKSLDIFRHLLSGQSVVAVAAAFGVTPAAVYKVKHRVRDFLSEVIAEQLVDEEGAG